MGPRGRRLCLEWAKRLSAEQADGPDVLAEALMVAASVLEDGGTSMIVTAKEHPDDPDPEPLAPRTPEQVAGLISAVPLRAPTRREILLIMAESVGRAMYWQPPWGEDRLATMQPIRRALEPAAATIAGSPARAWWESPIDLCSQWQTEEIRPADPGPAPAPPADNAKGLLEHDHRRVLEDERRFHDEYAGQDVSGEWWCIPPYRLASSTRCLPDAGPVGLWCEEDGNGPERVSARRIIVPPHPRVLEITGPDDWTALCARFPLDVSASRRYVWGETTGRTGGWLMPDWPAVAASGVDAVHLTVAGYLTTAGRALPVTSTHATVLGGWDPDTTWWLIDVEIGGPVVWEMDQGSEDLTYRRVPVE